MEEQSKGAGGSRPNDSQHRGPPISVCAHQQCAAGHGVPPGTGCGHHVHPRPPLPAQLRTDLTGWVLHSGCRAASCLISSDMNVISTHQQHSAKINSLVISGDNGELTSKARCCSTLQAAGHQGCKEHSQPPLLQTVRVTQNWTPQKRV